MTQVQSTKVEPYCDFPKQAYSIITDDFCHEKFLVVKPTLKTSKAIIKLKQTITYKKESYNLSEQLKLWFDLPRAGTLYAKVKSGDYLKLHYDDGKRVYQGKTFNLYFGLNTNRALDLSAVKFGVSHDSQHCHSDNRLKITNQKGNQNYYWYNRTMVYHNKFRFGLVTCLDVCNKILQKNNILLGYQVDANTRVFARAQVDGYRTSNAHLKNPQTIFDKLKFDIVRNFNNQTTGGLQVDFSVKNKNLQNVQAVVQVLRPNKQLVKIGVNRYLDFQLVYKRPFDLLDNNATISAGAAISGLTKNNFVVKNGFELGLNL